MDMGAIAEALMAYAQPLLEQTDGSGEDLNRALALGTLCYNLALLPADRRETAISEMRPTLNMDEDEFDDFRRSLIDPMIQRHEEMFPLMHRRLATGPSQNSPLPRSHQRMEAPVEKSPVPDRYAPCPCNSGEKYKFCCGAKRR
jgi:SEC-C motif